MKFSEKCRRLRAERGWTQEELAQACFVSRSAVSKWETDAGYPDIENLKQLAALAVIVGRSLNVAQTESYIERLLAQAQVTPPQSRPTYIIKDVRLFLNSIDRSLQMIRQCGVDADLGRRDTDSEILLTIRIPKQRAVRPS